MTTLAESFLADLDDLSDESDRDLNNQQQEDGGADEVRQQAASTSSRSAFGFCTCKAQLSLVQMLVDNVENLSYDNLENVAHLRASERYQDIMQVSHAALRKSLPKTLQHVWNLVCLCLNGTADHMLRQMSAIPNSAGFFFMHLQRVKDALEGKEVNERAWTGPSEDEPTYKLLVDCNQLAVDIDNEIGIIHNFMRDKYRLKFPELESLVHHPIDYARVVQAIGNDPLLTLSRSMSSDRTNLGY